jgi:hypothetical protein
VLLALTQYADELNALQSASQRPAAVFQMPRGWQGFDFHHGLFWNISSVLRLRATARVAAGQNEEAIQDIRLILFLAGAQRSEPTLSALQSETGILAESIQPIWEGLVSRCWTDGELTALQRLLSEVDLPGAYARAVRGETLLQMQRYDDLFSGDPKRSTGYVQRAPFLLTSLYPSGWIDLHKASLYHRLHNDLLPMIDAERRCVIDAKQLRDDRAALPSGIFGQRAFPGSLRAFLENLARGQVSIDLALMACALERYYLAHGEYPERLEVLAPTYLERIPTDTIDGDLLRYRRNPDGRFILYSVGWNRRDDGGSSKNGFDWVWTYPSP